MAFLLKHLIKGAISRARVTRQVDAIEIVRFVNDALHRFLPHGFQQSAKAISYKDGTVFIHVLSSSVRHALSATEEDLLRKLRETYPEKKFERFLFRVGRRFPNEDV